MQGLLVDGPNRGTVVHIDKPMSVFRILDPDQPSLLQACDDGNPSSLKVNIYYGEPAHPFAFVYGFEWLFRFYSTNITR